MSTKLQHGLESLGVAPILHQPSRRLRAEEDADSEDEGRDKSGAKLKTPSNVARVLDDDVGAEAQENT